MAEYREFHDPIRAAGAGVLAVSVDEPERSEALRRKLRLPFPILCDTRRELIRAWSRFNPKEKGGIARPSVFVIGRDRRVLFRSLDDHIARVSAETVVKFLRGEMKPEEAQDPPRRKRWPSLAGFARALLNALRFGARSPGA